MSIQVVIITLQLSKANFKLRASQSSTRSIEATYDCLVLVETSWWADPSSKGSCHERIHLTAQFRKPVNGWSSAALACSTKHEADIHETSELIPLRSQCSTYSKAGNTRDLRIFQWFGPCFQRSQIIIGKWDFSFFWDIMQRRLIVNDVSEQPIGPIIKDHDCLSLKEFIDRSSRNVYNKLSRYVCVTSQNSKDLIT